MANPRGTSPIKAFMLYSVMIGALFFGARRYLHHTSLASVYADPVPFIYLVYALFFAVLLTQRIIRHELFYRSGKRLGARQQELQADRLDFAHHRKDEIK